MAKKIKGFGGKSWGGGSGKGSSQINLQMAKVQQMLLEFEEKRQALEESFAERTVEVSVGGGVLKLTATLTYELKDIEVMDEDLAEDWETFKDLLIAGVNQVMQEVTRSREEAYEQLQSEISPNLPGIM
ncbi:MAG: nucleoid-associated protein EbfC [Thermotogota bacterium]|nr:nucleoid-associated protein EbfC [Thermotogota bacterium]MDK2865386.1 nucleoid-associated protein EbfC [Thermotogota bacterium]HCZ05668.1 hypothetical protein [Thermotogota bacterium]